MKKQLDKVSEFHRTFRLGIEEKPVSTLENGKARLRYELMKEENEEYIEAAENDDIIEVGEDFSAFSALTHSKTYTLSALSPITFLVIDFSLVKFD